MSYPVWEPFVANSLIIAVVAILHVFVSHFAIGGGLYLVLAEIWARRKDDKGHLAYVERHSKFFILLTIVFGAVTGVGIWVTIGLIHPVGTKWLINNFVWGWATEWVMFFVEIAAALVYFYGWKKLSASAHIAVGWIYFIAAWLSLAVINGILTFMLTPGEWITTGNFWDGFFNPAYWPATFFRTFICLMLAGLYATLTIAKEKDIPLKIRIMRRNGFLILISILLAIPFGLWYFNSLPEAIRAGVMPGMIPSIALQLMIFSAAVLFLLTLLGNIIFPRHTGYVSAAILLVCGLLSMGGFEWARESLRKPYIIHGFLYSNGQLVSDDESLPAGYPIDLKFTTGNRGRDLYLNGCRSCHTKTGYMSLADRLAGLEEEHIVNIIPRLQYFIAIMPPFPGNDTDVQALAQYLTTIAEPDPLTTIASLSEARKSEIVFQRRCNGCHTMTGFRSLSDTFDGLDYEIAEELIQESEYLAAEMPPFTGSDTELRLLINHLTGAEK